MPLHVLPGGELSGEVLPPAVPEGEEATWRTGDLRSLEMVNAPAVTEAFTGSLPKDRTERI